VSKKFIDLWKNVFEFFPVLRQKNEKTE